MNERKSNKNVYQKKWQLTLINLKKKQKKLEKNEN